MKYLVAFACFITICSAELSCEHRTPDIPKDWMDMVDPCVREMREQIQRELNASIQYLAMGAHFSKDKVNRPGFAHFFFESASEEREHAIKLISYLLMRGELTSEVNTLVKKQIIPETTKWSDATSALRDALKLEALVTKNIQKVIQVCENPKPELFNDYHLVDYLTGEFLEEQYKGQSDLARKISVLDKMRDTHGAIGEFLFDKKLLSNEM